MFYFRNKYIPLKKYFFLTFQIKPLSQFPSVRVLSRRLESSTPYLVVATPAEGNLEEGWVQGCVWSGEEHALE